MTKIEIKFVPKGWGFEKWIVNNEKYCGKLLYFAKGKKCSWHYHKIKDEVFYIQSGKILVKFSDQDDIENIRNNAMAAFAAQNRAITREDYVVRCYSMPKKFGSVAKAYILGDTQQIKADKPYIDNTEVLNPMALNLYTLAYDVDKRLVPLNRMANQDEYNSAIQFLCSDASKFLNGHNLIIDGGRSIW